MRFFDRPFIVNRILWSQYHKIAYDAVNLFSSQKQEINNSQTVAGISCAYGDFYPKLVMHKHLKKLFLFDVAPIQLAQMQSKISKQLLASKCQLFLSNAEQISLASGSVDSSVLFFLLHELPISARINVLAETIRITKSGGRIIVADYALNQGKHLFNRVKFFNLAFEKLEPFLSNFWSCNLTTELSEQGKLQSRKIKLISERYYFNDFYRLLEFQVQ